MSQAVAGDLRAFIAATVREVVAELVTDSIRDALTEDRRSGQGAAATRSTPLAEVPAKDSSSTVPAPVVAAAPDLTAGRSGAARVRIRDDRDLEQFARHLLELFENPKNRQDLRAGRYRFSLLPSAQSGPGTPVPARRIERGAVTERHVNGAAEAGERIVLGPRAVITPLARERARSLGVDIEKER